MKKNFSLRILSWILAVLMLVSVMPTSVFAESDSGNIYIDADGNVIKLPPNVTIINSDDIDEPDAGGKDLSEPEADLKAEEPEDYPEPEDKLEPPSPGAESDTPDNADDGIATVAEENVAKVGETGYATIDEAIAKWTNGTTLTLLADVTLSDVITLKSTEHHILNLGTYTMTAASGKNAFVIKACGNGSAERTAITINADATNPGGINAGSKCVVYYKYADGGISAEDRPIIKINGGVFTGSTSSWGTAGIYTIGTAARKCATLDITGGTFNCSINGSGKSKLLISGGTFNYSVGSQGDSTALRLISGGTFKTFGFMTADSNNTKFWFGTSMANSNVGVHVDDNGYIVVGGPVVTEAGETFKASSTNYSAANSLLQYSSAKDNGLYYTSVKEAFADNNTTSGKVTVYVDELDMSGINFKGTIVVPEGNTLRIKNAPENLKVEGEGEVVIVKPVAQIGEKKYTSLEEALADAADGATIELIWVEGDAPIAMNGSVYGKTVTITGKATVDWSKGFLFVGRGGEGDGTVIFDNAKLTSTSNSASYGIHVSGREKNTNNKYDGTLTIKNSTIELDYLINKGTMTLDNSTLTVKNGFAIGGRPASETESGADATATLTLNNSKVVVNNHNGMGLGYEALGVMNIDATSTFECTQSFLVTAKGTMNVNGGTIKVAGTLTNNGEIKFTDVDLTDMTIDGTGTTRFYNTINFYGTNSITSGINGTPFKLIVNKGATLLITRFVLGYDRAITVYGEIEDAHSFDPTGKTPSLKFNSTSGVSVGGTDTGNLTVKDAYVELDSSSWKNAYGTYEWSFENSYVSATSFTNNNARSNDTAVWNVTFNDSVLVAKNYIKNGVGTTYNFINGSVATTGSLRIDGVMNIDATSSVTTTAQQNNKVGALDEHGGINGTVNVEGTLTIGSNAKTQLEILGGELNVNGNGKVALGNNTLTLDAASSLTIDVTGMNAGEYAGIEGTVVNAGTIKVEGSDTLEAKIVDGKIVLVRKLAGEGTEAKPYKISSLEELILFRDSVNAGETRYNAPGVYVALTADIDMAGATWERGIGDGINATFDGIFDGNEKTIKNLNFAPNADSDGYICGGLFGYTHGAAVIKNLVLENITVTANGAGHNVGVLVGFANNNGGKLTVSNVTVKNVAINAPNAYGVGAIVGYSYRAMGTIENCSVDGATITGYSFVGGITGYSYSEAIIRGCSVKNASITATSKGAGGIAGLALNGNITDNTVSNTTVTASTNWGYVVGELGESKVALSNNTAAEPQIGGDYKTGEAYQAKIGNKYYTTLQAAINAAQAGETVVLVNDCTVASIDATDANIDLNGKTLTLTAGGTNFFGNSTVKNGKINITGCVAKGDCIIGIGNYSNSATLNLNGVNITGDGYNSAYAVLYVYNSSTLNINGGSIVVANDNASAGGVIKAHSAANGKINITGTATDPVELKFTNAKIGILDGTVVMDYVDLDIEGGANAINQSALTVKNSTLTIKNADGRALTLSQGDVVIINSDLDFSGCTEGEIRFKKALNLNVDADSTIAECDIWSDVSSGAKVNDTEVTGTEKVPSTIDNATVTNPAWSAKVGSVYYMTLAEAIAAAKTGETVTILAGDYTGNLNVNKAITVVGEGTVNIAGKLNITADGAAVKNLNVKNSGTACYIGAKNVLVERCTLVGSNGLYQSYTSGTVTFKNSTITGATYGIHFDGSAGGNIVIDNCVITGWTSFAGTINKVTISKTEFAKGNYNQLRFYQDVELTNVKFNPNMTVDFGTGNVEATFNGCSVTDGSSLLDVIYLPDIAQMGVEVKIDDAPVVVEAMIGNTAYLTIEEALNKAQNGDTIVLYVPYVIENGATVVIDLTGKTLKGSILAPNADLTIKGGKIVNTDKSVSAVEINGGKLTLVNVDIDSARHAVRIDGAVEATIDGGEYTISATSGTRHAVNVSGAADVTIKSGKFVGPKGTTMDSGSAVCVQSGAKVTIEGGDFSGGKKDTLGVSGTMVVNGGTFDQDPTKYVDTTSYKVVKKDGKYEVKQIVRLTIVVTPVAPMAIREDIIYVATMDEAVAKALEKDADYVVYQIAGPVELTTGFAHGILDLGKNVIIEGVTSDAKLTIVGGGVPDIKGVTFKNITLADEGTYLTTANEFMYQNYIDCTFENVTFVDGIRVSGNTTIKNCKVDANTANEYAIWLDDGEFTMTGTTVTAGNDAYGLIKSDEVDKITITGNTFRYFGNANKEALNVKGATIVANDNKFIDCTKGIIPADKTNYAADGTTVLTNEALAGANEVIIYVAKIGDNYYETLDAAIAAIGDGYVVIELLADATLDYNARDAYGTAGTTSVTINGNGHTLTLNQKNNDWASIGLANADAKLVLKNMTIEKTGYGDTTGAWNTHAIIFSCNVEMTDVTVNNSVAVQNGATLTNVTINEANGYYGLWINGNGQTVTMNGGAINATNGGRGIKIADQYVGTPAEVTLAVTGTKFNTAKKAAVLVSSTAGATITATNVDITNVVADSTNVAWVDEAWATSFGNVTVNGAPAAQENASAFTVAIVDSNDKVVAYYKSLAAAIAAAQDSNNTITLLADVEASEVILIGKSLTINGNGHKVTSSATRVFRITTSDVEVTLNNVNVVSTAVRVGTNDIRGIAIDPSLANVKLTLNNCSVDFTDASACDWSYAVNVAGNGTGHIVTINGGTYEGANVINVYGANNTIVVKDATLNCLYPNNDMYAGACIWVLENQGSSVKATGNTFNGNNAIAFNLGTGTALTESNNTDNTTEVVAKIGSVYYTSLDAAFAAAQAGDEVKILRAGTYALSTSGKDIIITGMVDGVVFDNIGAKGMEGANVTFNNVTFDYYPNVNYTGLQHSGNLVYNNCTFNGQVFLYGESETFNKCTFNQNSADAYNVWTYGAKEVAFNECTFNSVGKSVLVYTETKTATNNVSVTKSTFNASAPVDGKAAIEIDTSLSAGANITIDAATTATGFGTGNVSGNSLWNNKKGSNTDATNDLTVKVGGTTVLAPVTFVAKIGEIGYTTIAEAIADIGDGYVVIELLADATLDYNARDAYGTAGTTSVTINGNGHTLTLNQKNSDWASIGLANANAKLVLNGVIINKTGYGATGGAWNTHAIIFSCNVEMTDVTVNNSVAVQNGATLNNVTINEANGYYGLWINGNGQTVTMNGGAINATNGGRGIKIADQYVDSPAEVTLAVTGTKFNTAKKAAVLVSSTAGAIITASNVNIAGVAEDKTNFAWVDEDWAANFGNVTVTGDATVAQEAVENFVVSVNCGDKVVGYYKFLAEAFEAANDGDTIKVLKSVAPSKTIKVNANVTLDLNGKTISGTDNETKSFALFEVQPGKEFTVVGDGKITLASTNNRGWNAYSSVISVQRAKLIVNGGTIEHLGGTDMAYAIDILTNTGVGNAEAIINGGTIKSTYRAIRQFANSTKAENILTVNGGTIEGANKSIWVQNANSSNNPAELTVNEDATIKGDVLLSGAGATELTLEISVNSAALQPSSTVVGSKLPATMAVKETNGTWKVVDAVASVGGVGYATLEDAFKAATAGCEIEILTDVVIDYKWDARYTGAKFTVPVTINGNGHKIKFTGKVNDNNWNTIFRFEENATVNDLTIDISGATGAQRVISAKKSLTVDGLTIIGSARYGIIFGEGASATDLAATEIVITNSTLNGTRRAISDNEGGKNVKSITVVGNTINANVYLSASESVTFNNNVTAGEVDIRCYGADSVLSVEAKGNTLNTSVKNYILAKTIDAQEEFVINHPTFKVATKAELDAALNTATAGDTIVLVADIDYGTTQLAITKAITLDLGGKTLTTRNAYGGMSVKNNATIKNGTIVHASNTAAIKVWNAVAFEDLVIDVQGKGDANKTIGGIVLQSGSTTCVGSIKNVTIKGVALTNGIETYNCGDATQNVIGSMENVNIDANGTAMLISAPVGTATNCTFDGGVSGVELWIKGNYSATLTLVNCDVNGGKQAVYVHDEFNSDPSIVNNGKLALVADNDTTFTSESRAPITVTIKHAVNVVEETIEDIISTTVAKIGDTYYTTLQAAIDAAVNGDTITLVTDIAIDTMITNTKKITLDLNGKTITGTDNATGSFAIITNKGELTITGNGTITLTATNNRGWNAYSSVISNTVGGKLTVESGIIEHLGGTDMAYAIDNLTNGKGTYAETVINGGTIKSTYRAIRQFLNGVEAQNILTINGGTIEGANKSVWMQDPSKNANTGTLTICENAVINGDVYLTVTAESTEWPVEFSIAAAALKNGSTVLTTNVPAQFAVVNVNGVYSKVDAVAKIGNVGYATLAEAVAAAAANAEIVILKAGTYSVPTGKDLTITGAVDGVKFDMSKAVGINASMTFNNVTFEYGNANYVGLQHAGEMVYNNCIINGQVFLYGTSETFNNCTFNQTSSDAYNVWTYGAKEVAFNECTFNSVGKSVLIYAESASITNDVTVTDCDFIASAPADGKAAIEMDSSLTSGIKLTIDAATTATGFGTGNVSGNSLWNNKKDNKTDANNDITVVVNGETVLAPVTFTVAIGADKYATLAEAIAAAQAGDTIKFLADITEDVTITKDLTIDGDKYNYTGKMTLNKVNVTIQNVDFIKGSIYKHKNTGAGGDFTIKNCTFDGQGLNDYAINLGGTDDIVIEDCTANNYGYGFLQVSASNASVTVKNVVVTNVNYGFKIDYSNGVTLENVTVMNAEYYGIYDSNFGTKTYTITNCKLEAIKIWERAAAKTTTFEFVGTNAVTTLDASNYAKYVLADVNATLTAPEGQTVTTDVANYSVKYADGKYFLAANIVAIGEKTYETLAKALAAAKAGDTITLLADITEDVTISKAVTIDGAGKTYTGAMTLKADTTIKNVNFDGKGYNGYAITTRGAQYLTIEDCTAKNYGYGFVQLASGTALTTVKNVTISNMNYGVKVDYSNAVVLENVDITVGVAAVLNSNYGEKTITIKNSKLNILGTWKRNDTIKTTFVFEGANTIDQFVIDAAIDNFKLALGATLTAPNEITATATEAGYSVKYADGKYFVKANVVAIGEETYASLAEALAAAQAGDTITLLADITEDVTISKAVTIDGAGKTYTGAMTLKADTTIKNVNFDGKGYNGYAITTRGAQYLTIEDCTAKNYVYGFVQLASGTALTTVKNVTISNMNYGVKVDYSNAVVLENADITVGVAAVLNSNYGEKTITIKNSKLNILGTWTRNSTVKTNYVFEGANTIDQFVIDATIDNFKLADNATLTAPNSITVTTDVTNAKVVYENGTYKVVAIIYVAEVNGVKYEKLAEAINNATAGQTITLLADVTENVTINKNITIDGGNFKYTGTMTANAGLTITIQNVNFVNGGIDKPKAQKSATGIYTIKNCTFDGEGEFAYAFRFYGANTVTIENCTVKDYLYSFLYIVSGTNTVSVKNVTVEDCPNYAVYFASGVNNATVENLTVKNSNNGFIINNSANRTLTIKDCKMENVDIAVDYSKGTNTITCNVLGQNDFGCAKPGEYTKYVLAEATATLTAHANYKVTTNVADHNVVYEDGTYKLVALPFVAQIGDKQYTSLAEAIKKAQSGDTIKIIADHELDGSTYVTGTYGYDNLIVISGKTLIIDFNGKTITVTPNAPDANGGLKGIIESIIFIEKGANLTLNGEGGFKVNKGTGLYSLIYNSGSTLTIESGNYIVEEMVTAASIIYAEGNHTTVVNGGNFRLGNAAQDPSSTKPWIFNTEGKNDSFIQVNGGTFNQNILMHYGTQKDCEVDLADGWCLHLNQGNGIWTVVEGHTAGAPVEEKRVEATFTEAGSYEEVVYCTVCGVEISRTKKTIDALGAVAQIGDKQYTSLAEALAAAPAGDIKTVVLRANVDEIYTVIPAGITLDLNGWTITTSYLASFGSIIDGTEGGHGMIKTAMNSAVVRGDSEFVPLYDNVEGAYKFFYVTKFAGYKPETNKDQNDVIVQVTYAVDLKFANGDAYKIIAAGNSGLKLNFNLTFNVPGRESHIFKLGFSDNALMNYAKERIAFYENPDNADKYFTAQMTVTGFNAEDNHISSAVMIPAVESVTGYTHNFKAKIVEYN